MNVQPSCPHRQAAVWARSGRHQVVQQTHPVAPETGSAFKGSLSVNVVAHLAEGVAIQTRVPVSRHKVEGVGHAANAMTRARSSADADVTDFGDL